MDGAALWRCSRRRAAPLAVLWAASALFPARAWVDHGHMLAAAIAAKHAPNGTEERLSRLLKQEADFVNFTDLPGCAVWCDHIKCPDDSHSWCQGLRHPIGSLAFDSFHYMVWPFGGRQQLEKEELPTYDGNPVDVLTRILPTLLGGSDAMFTWSFHARLWIHVYADLHQPLHVGDYVNSSLFRGHGSDEGGNLIEIIGDARSLGESLHLLWDLAAGNFPKSWPINRQELDNTAAELERRFPAQSFVDANRLDESWQQPASCTQNSLGRKLAKAVVDTRSLIDLAYGEYLANKSHDTEYAPSVAYIAQLRETAASQIALAGYRLTSVLACISPHIPSACGPGPNPRPESRGMPVALGVLGWLGFVSTATAGLVAVWRQRAERRRRARAMFALQQDDMRTQLARPQAAGLA